MTINDQNRDENLQYDINREAAKISALSSGKINKYEYFTGEEILPSNQKQIIEQTKFTYSPLGKASEKTNKSNEDQGKKQVDAWEDLKPKELEAIKDNKSDGKFSMLEKMSNKLLDERMHEIQKMSDEINFNDLTYYFTSPNLSPIKFLGFRGP